MSDLHPPEEDLFDLALGDVDRTDRGQLVRHLAACPSCRARYDAILHPIEMTLSAAPRVEPPPGFDHKVLTSMGMEPGLTRRWTRPSPHRVLVAAAAALVGMVVGVAATLALDPDDAGSPGSPGSTASDGSVAAAPSVLARGSQLTTADGEMVGSVTRSWLEGRPVIVVAVTSGPAGMHYECRLQLADGEELVVGDWVLDDEHGGTWVVPTPRSRPVGIDLVTDRGDVWSSAEL